MGTVSELLQLNMQCLVVFLISSLLPGLLAMHTGSLHPPPYSPPSPPPNDGYGDVPVVMYNPDMQPNDNGYSNERPAYCHMEDRITYVDRCEDYTEQTCYTQNRQECQNVDYRNCTGVVDSKVDPVCLNVNELLCGLNEEVGYDTITEEFTVQKCTVVKDRVCDTTYNIDVDQKDDFQCADIESVVCQDKEVEIKDVTCKNTFEFDCEKEKRTDGGYGMEKVCRKTPINPCYETPRTIRIEVCRQQTQQYCQKFTNPLPRPVERQNCHFEPKKICELEKKTRNKKAKRYSYAPDCKRVPREICDQTVKNKVAPICETVMRHVCSYIPEKKCMEEQKQYCWKVEQKVQEEVCDEKFEHEIL